MGLPWESNDCLNAFFLPCLPGPLIPEEERMGGSRGEGRLTHETLVYVLHDARFLDFCRSSSHGKIKERENSGSSLLFNLVPWSVQFLLSTFQTFFCVFHTLSQHGVCSQKKKQGEKKHSIPPSTGLLIRTLTKSEL